MKEKNQLAQSRLNLPSPFLLMQEISVGNVVLAFSFQAHSPAAFQPVSLGSGLPSLRRTRV